MATIVDVAKMAGVSISTVSCVINENKYVSAGLKQRVYDAIEKLDYKINPVARSLKSKKTSVFGVIITDISSPYYSQILSGLENAAHKAGYSLTFCSSNWEIEKELYYLRLLERSWVDGIVLDSIAVAGQDNDNKNYILKTIVKRRNISVVCLNQALQKYDGIDGIIIDNKESSYVATKHLIEKGYNQIAHILGNSKYFISKHRLDGYKRALEEYSIPFDTRLVKQGDFSPISGYEAMKVLLKEGIKLNAVFAANDQMGIGAIRAIKESGLRIPEDIAVVGFDNLPVSSLIDPTLTTINVPKYRLGYLSMEILLDKIETNRSHGRKEELPTNLVVRRSSDINGDSAWDLFGL